jgi:hypothetical protein
MVVVVMVVVVLLAVVIVVAARAAVRRDGACCRHGPRVRGVGRGVEQRLVARVGERCEQAAGDVGGPVGVEPGGRFGQHLDERRGVAADRPGSARAGLDDRQAEAFDP